MSEPIVLDNSELFEAADALEREARILEIHAPLDARDTVEAMLETARKLRDIGNRAEASTTRYCGNWRGVLVVVQGTDGPPPASSQRRPMPVVEVRRDG